MEQVIFAIITDEKKRSEMAVEALVREYVYLGAPWLCWFISDK